MKRNTCSNPPIPGRSDCRAFTVPEILAVVAIIIIVMSLLLSALSGSRDPVYAVVCETNLRQLMIANHAYANDNLGFLPFPNWGGYGQDLGGGWKGGGWMYWNKNNVVWDQDSEWTPDLLDTGLIYKYHNNRQLYRCPKDKAPWPMLSGQISSYNMNGSACGYGSNLTFRRSQFRSGDFLMWEVDPFVVQAGWWWDGANHPDEGISTIWHQQGGTLVAIDGHCEWMQYGAYAAEKAIGTRNRLWNAPDTANGH